MTKLRIAFLCFAFSFASSVVTAIGMLHYFLPQGSVGVFTNAPIPASPPFTARQGAAAAPQPPRTQVSAIKICDGDIAKICSDDKHRLPMECLQDHFDEVSPPCHKSLQAMRNIFEPCKSEIVQYCASVGYGGGRMAKCLHLHQNEPYLSEACAQVIKNL